MSRAPFKLLGADLVWWQSISKNVISNAKKDSKIFTWRLLLMLAPIITFRVLPCGPSICSCIAVVVYLQIIFNVVEKKEQ